MLCIIESSRPVLQHAEKEHLVSSFQEVFFGQQRVLVKNRLSVVALCSQSSHRYDYRWDVLVLGSMKALSAIMIDYIHM